MRSYSVCDGKIVRELDLQYIELADLETLSFQIVRNGPQKNVPILEPPTGRWQINQTEPVEITYDEINGKKIIATINGYKITDPNCFLIKATSEHLGKELAWFSCCTYSDYGQLERPFTATCQTSDKPSSCLIIGNWKTDNLNFYTVEKDTAGQLVYTYYKITKIGQPHCYGYMLTRSDSNRSVWYDA